jgi:hypothetical protein
MNRKRLSPIFLVLGLVFLAVGWATDQEAFTYAAIAFLAISLFAGGRLFIRK